MLRITAVGGVLEVNRVLAVRAPLVIGHTRKASTWLPVWLPDGALPRSIYALSWSGWPDSNRRPPAPKLKPVPGRGGLERSCRSTELGSSPQRAFRTLSDSLSLGSHVGSP